MKNMLLMELKKSVSNNIFKTAIILGIVCSFLNTMSAFIMHTQYIETIKVIESQQGYTRNPQLASSTLYNNWIGGESMSLGTSLFFFLLPLLIALPYGWSYCEEKNSNYMGSIIIRGKKKAYLLAKYCAVFVSGGLAAAIPLLFNLLSVAMIVPARVPLVNYNVYYGVFGQSVMSKLYYTHPLIYVLCYIAIDFVFCGVLAEASFAVAAFVKQKWICVISPFLVCLGISYSRNLIYYKPDVIYKQISPFAFLRPSISGYDADLRIILLMALAIGGITLGVILCKEMKNECL